MIFRFKIIWKLPPVITCLLGYLCFLLCFTGRLSPIMCPAAYDSLHCPPLGFPFIIVHFLVSHYSSVFWCFWIMALTHKACNTSPWFPEKDIFSKKKNTYKVIIKKNSCSCINQIVYLVIKCNCVRSFIFGMPFTLLNINMVLNLCRDFHWNLMIKLNSKNRKI